MNYWKVLKVGATCAILAIAVLVAVLAEPKKEQRQAAPQPATSNKKFNI